MNDRFKAGIGSRYHYIALLGVRPITCGTIDKGDSIDERRYSEGNYFRTSDLAYKAGLSVMKSLKEADHG